ncbi:MAG TPA: patatin-like phospholipase family protein, partial [Coleofasciculaceae cyanobacterium]
MEINPMNFSHPHRECDLVMKGGITSGIVYPRIVLKLASEGGYRFRNVGGTSAGAIAAAVMAAAEFGRETGGFERFYELSQKLAEPGFLFNLFQPSPSLKPLMYTLLEILGKISPDVGLDASHSSSGHPQPPNAQPSSTPRKIKPSIGGALQLVNILKRRHPTVAHAGARQGALIGLGVALLLTAIASLVFYGVA